LPATLMTTRGENDELRLQASFHRLPYVPLMSDPWIDLDLRLECGHHDGITAVTEVADGHRMMTTTAKNAALPTRGQLTIREDGREAGYSLAGGLGGFDYTSGYLPRHTSWRWAFTVGRSTDNKIIGLNLVSGFSGIGDRSTENMIWIDGTPHRLDPAARIHCEVGEPMKPWSITTADGALDLVFQPMSVHQESLNLGAIRSSFIQPSGHFTGTITVDGERISVDALPGVVEDQDVLW
jgi:hypothetical protein